MKKMIALILCMLYTFVSIGGSIFMHKCNHKTLISFYNEFSGEHCPICNKNHDHNSCDLEHTSSTYCQGKSCDDIEVKIDQPNETIKSAYTDFQMTTPAILVRLWVILFNPFTSNKESNYDTNSNTLIAESSPPTYLLLCTFII